MGTSHEKYADVPCYTMETGEADRRRLTLLNNIYNPATYDFFRQFDLRSGMYVLEIGCGCGELACWLAEQVGPDGKVVAVDQDKRQLQVARALAKRHGLANIEFKQLSIVNLKQLTQIFDFAYARWTLMYLKDPQIGLQLMYQTLRKDGVLICEDIDSVGSGVFAYPETDVIRKWIELWKKNFVKLGLRTNFFTYIYEVFKKLKCSSISVKINQQVLMTEEEKSILRLGMLATRSNILANKVTTNDDFDIFIKDTEIFEKQDSLIGFVRNILIGGRKC